MPENESWTPAPCGWIETFRNSYLEMRFNLNRFYYGIAPLFFKEECYLRHCRQTYQVCPLYTNSWYLGCRDTSTIICQENRSTARHTKGYSVLSRPKVSGLILASSVKSFCTKWNFSSSYHPETDGQTERVNQILEDMLRACVLDFQGKWEDYLAWWSSPIIIAINPPLKWPLSKHCMRGSV